ncbi:MAG: spore germination protein [Firmicutes bacterium]|nr:spore germination protein [Bacillota bacterium]
MSRDRQTLVQLQLAAHDLLDKLTAVVDLVAALRAGLLDPRWLRRKPLGGNLDETLALVSMAYENTDDFTTRSVSCRDGRRAVLAFLSGTVNEKVLDRSVIQPLKSGGDVQALFARLHRAQPTETLLTMGDVVERIAAGKAVFWVEDEPRALAVKVARFSKRSVNRAGNERVIRGPKDGFTEDLDTNISLVRRRIRSPHLKFVALKVGDFSRTEVRVAYIEGIARASLVEEIVRRIRRIRIDGVLDSAQIEEFVEDNPWSIFRQSVWTERPDTAVGGLLEGRVAILVDNTPTALVVPSTFWQIIQSAEDYYESWFAASALRYLRFFFLFAALLLPATYVAVTTFHQSMLPPTLLLTLANARERVPFPAMIEALIIELSFEILREAAIRVPQYLTQAVSIVGALVIGSAAIQASIASAPMVIVVAMTGIANFALPHFNQALAVRVLRFPLVVLAGILGFYGLILGLLVILVHAAGLRSFGTPFLQPAAPLRWRNVGDFMGRLPWFAQPYRTPSAETNPVREAPGQQPQPPRVAP